LRRGIFPSQSPQFLFYKIKKSKAKVAVKLKIVEAIRSE
jgi:hypothetical protein